MRRLSGTEEQNKMARKPKPRVKAPKTASKGEVITIKTLISHKMETGLRKDKKTGEKIPRNIINKFIAKFNGETVFSVDIDPAISANPYFQFPMKAEESGEFEFIWIDDKGETYSKKSKLTVN
ncbi:MAG: thiosulfate oxidation carrier complex protein SoxZ [Methyloligellaceae bacterium]